MGHDPGGRRHSSKAWLDMKPDDSLLSKGRKLVVQMVETFQDSSKSTLVEELDALAMARDYQMQVAPVMIYAKDVTHVLTEEGIAYVYKAESLEQRRAMIAAVAGVTPIGLNRDPVVTAELRAKGLVAYPEDLGIRRSEATRDLLAARSIGELESWSGGLYNPPAKFRSW